MNATPLGFRATLTVLAAAVVSSIAVAHPVKAASAPKPVYIHENGANDFLESVVAVRPGQPVEFVNEDSGEHTVVGYKPYKAGAKIKGFRGTLAGTKGPGHKVGTYRVTFAHAGIYPYYCSVHAHLVTVYHHGNDHYVAPVRRPKVPGYGGPMAGVIIVTKDRNELAMTPPTAHKKILPHYFGG